MTMPHHRCISDLSAVTCSPDEPTSAILERLNGSPHLFFIVVDNDQRALGTITDGDIRRAILDGATLSDPARRCMHDDFQAGRIGDDTNNIALLEGLPFLPILDEQDRIAEIIVPTASSPTFTTALVMAGGKGSRLGARTRDKPKPLLPVGDRPILQRILSDLEEAGVRRIFVSVHYLADQIEAFIKTRENKANITTVKETEMLGTAGALGLLPEPLSSPILVVNGDLITQTDFEALNNFHWRHGHDASIAVAQHETEVPFGVIKLDENGLFQGIDEKPTIRHFVAAGIYYLSPECCALIPPNTKLDMPSLLNRIRAAGLKIGLFPIHEYWLDVGRPSDLERAHADVTAESERNS